MTIENELIDYLEIEEKKLQQVDENIGIGKERIELEKNWMEL